MHCRLCNWDDHTIPVESSDRTHLPEPVRSTVCLHVSSLWWPLPPAHARALSPRCFVPPVEFQSASSNPFRFNLTRVASGAVGCDGVCGHRSYARHMRSREMYAPLLQCFSRISNAARAVVNTSGRSYRICVCHATNRCLREWILQK